MNNKYVKILALIAAILLVMCVAIAVFGRDEGPSQNKNDTNKDSNEDRVKVPSINQLVYALNLEGEVKFDFTVLEENLRKNERFKSYLINSEYSMVYQITDGYSETEIKAYLGIEGELPKVNYSQNFLVLSTGRKIHDIGTNINTVTYNDMEVLDVLYSDEAYNENTVYVYSMNTSKFVSGEILENYYWENAMPESNFYIPETVNREVLSSGKYHKLYKGQDDTVECELYSSDGEKVIRRLVCQGDVKVTENKASLVKIDFGERNKYFNTQKNVFSEEYSFNTDYLIYNIITYMRVKNGQIQLILRDAYDSYFYAKIVVLPFSNDTENLDSLVESIKVIDDTHIEVEYYTGTYKTLVKETVEVYNLNR